MIFHDDVIKWKHFFPHYWPFVRGILRGPVNSPHKGQWRGALMFSFICVWINGWVNNREAGDLRRYRAHYDVSVMSITRSLVVVYLALCHKEVYVAADFCHSKTFIPFFGTLHVLLMPYGLISCQTNVHILSPEKYTEVMCDTHETIFWI